MTFPGVDHTQWHRAVMQEGGYAATVPHHWPILIQLDIFVHFNN